MRLLVVILSTFMVLGCAMQPQLNAVVKPKVEAPALTLDQIAFRAAITNAVAVSPALVYDKLFPINDTNSALAWKGPPEKRMLKVVSLMRQGAYDKYFKGKTKGRSDPGHPNWVTAAPQVQRFCQRDRSHRESFIGPPKRMDRPRARIAL